MSPWMNGWRGNPSPQTKRGMNTTLLWGSEPHKRVVFIPHFVCGLGFPLHPFIHGLMFYYGVDSYDLSPNSFLYISAFIAVCEAFLRIPPHFGLWLKIFNV